MPPKKGARKSKKRGAKTAAAEPASVRERRKACPDCGSGNILFDAEIEQVICHDCGQLFQELPPEMKREMDERKTELERKKNNLSPNQEKITKKDYGEILSLFKKNTP